MTKNSDAHLLDERYQALLDAYHGMERDDSSGMAEAIGYWRVIESYLRRVERDKKPSMRDPRSLTRYVGRYSNSEIKYETLRSLASG
jgi:hypothetical protein